MKDDYYDHRFRQSNADADIRPHAGRQEWLECMEKYADFVTNYSPETFEPPPVPHIKVALIDGGVDELYSSLDDSIADGESFCARSGDDYHSYYKSSGGHGTIMAVLIRKLCPKGQALCCSAGREDRGVGGDHSGICCRGMKPLFLWSP
jgi:hypothetical protein